MPNNNNIIPDSMKLVFGYTGSDSKTVLVVPGLTEQDVKVISEQIATSPQPFIEIMLDSKSNDTLVINKSFLMFFFATPCNEEHESKLIESRNKKKQIQQENK
jgi:hypothetical protein